MAISAVSAQELSKRQVVPERYQEKESKKEKVSFFSEEWSGHQISKLTGDNKVTDWLQGKDKVCTDEEDDGKLSFKEGAKSFLKGLVGGIPKAIVNHPLATIASIAGVAALTYITGGAILPVLCASGIVAGAGMAGYGTYKAITAETDGEAKKALETAGTGVTTVVLSALSAGKALDAAAKAGVKSAKVAEDANIFTKTGQLFKATPESLKVSGQNAKLWIQSLRPRTSVKISELQKSAVERDFADRKLDLQKRIEKYIRKNVKKANLNDRYLDPIRQQRVLDTITEDNIDLAEMLLHKNVEYTCTSNYASYGEQNCDYLLETVPRLLSSNDPKVKEAIVYILDHPDIGDKLFTLNVLDESTASKIMSLESECIPFGKYCALPDETKYDYDFLQNKIWKTFSSKRYHPEEHLPFIETYSPTTNTYTLKVFTNEGGSSIPGAYFDTDYNKYVIVQKSSVGKPNNLWAAEEAARGLIKQYPTPTPVPAVASASESSNTSAVMSADEAFIRKYILH